MLWENFIESSSFVFNFCYIMLAGHNFKLMISFKKPVIKHEVSYLRSCKILGKSLTRSKTKKKKKTRIMTSCLNKLFSFVRVLTQTSNFGTFDIKLSNLESK